MLPNVDGKVSFILLGARVLVVSNCRVLAPPSPGVTQPASDLVRGLSRWGKSLMDPVVSANERVWGGTGPVHPAPRVRTGPIGLPGFGPFRSPAQKKPARRAGGHDTFVRRA